MRKLLAGSVLVPALVVAAACSGSGGGGSGAEAQLLATAARQASDAGTFRFEGTLFYPVGEGNIEMPVEGEADTGSGGAAAGSGAEAFTTMVLDLSRSPLAGARADSIRMIIDGQTIYMRFPEGDEPGTGTAPGGKLWGKFDLGSTDQAGEGLELLLDRGTSAVPTRLLALLTGAGDVDREGTEEIRDVETRRYTMTADLQEVAATAPSPFASPAKDLLDLLGPVTVSAEVWLGPDDLPRRVTYTVDPAGTISRATMDFFDYGTPVERTRPPEADVFDFSFLSG